MNVLDNSVFDSRIEITLHVDTLNFQFGPGIFGPDAELRSLDSVRPSLLDPQSSGPDPLYGICMDVGRVSCAAELRRRHLLFGVVAFAAGNVGQEPVRSQGHVHAIAPHSGWSPPELFEVWQGRAIIYAQEHSGDHPGRCFAISAGPGDHVIVPPGWPHLVVNAEAHTRMVFAALCDREYGFEYGDVRARGGLAWFPIREEDEIQWKPNRAYEPSTLLIGQARGCDDFGLREGASIFEQFESDPDSVQWVSRPELAAERWKDFSPLAAVACTFTG